MVAIKAILATSSSTLLPLQMWLCILTQLITQWRKVYKCNQCNFQMVPIKAILATRSSTLLPALQMQTDSPYYSKCPKCMSIYVHLKRELEYYQTHRKDFLTHSPSQNQFLGTSDPSRNRPRNSTVPLYVQIHLGLQMVLLVFIRRVCFWENWRNLQMCQKVSSEGKSLID